MKMLPAGDRAAVQAAAVVAALLIAQQVAARAVRDALFLSAFEVSALPAILLASALVSVLGSLVFAAALSRRAPAAVISGALLLSAALLAAEWSLAAAHPRTVAAVLYVQVALLGPGIVSGFWSLVNERFDPHTARRVMGRIGTGASIGGVAGGALAFLGARALPVPALLLGLAAACVVTVAAVGRVRPLATADERDAGAGGVAAGLRSIGQYPYLSQLAAVVALGALSEVMLDYLLKAGAARTLTDGASLARFFSLFYGLVALVTLVLQAAATRPALDRLGLAATVSSQPAAVALAAATGLALPTLGAAVAARGLGSALRDSLFRSGYELFYAPLPPWQKRSSKALVDVAADKLGALLGAGVLIAIAALAAFPDRWLWAVALAAMSGSLLLARRLHDGYVRALERSLRAGLVALEPEEVMDSTTRYTLTRTALDRASLLAEIHALHGQPADTPDAGTDAFLRAAAAIRGGDPGRIRSALSTGDPDPALAPLLLALLAQDDASREALRALRRLAPRITGQLTDALLDPDQPLRVRRRVPRVLKASPTARAVEGLLLGLQDRDLGVRRACSAALAWMRGRHPELAVPAQPVYDAAARELAFPVTDADAALDHVFALLSVVGEREPLAVARWAVRGPDQRLRGTALEYLEQVLPEGVRQPLLQRLGTAAVAAPPARALGEIEDELRLSSASLPRGLVPRPRRD